jgi:hypothetical protein
LTASHISNFDHGRPVHVGHPNCAHSAKVCLPGEMWQFLEGTSHSNIFWLVLLLEGGPPVLCALSTLRFGPVRLGGRLLLRFCNRSLSISVPVNCSPVESNVGGCKPSMFIVISHDVPSFFGISRVGDGHLMPSLGWLGTAGQAPLIVVAAPFGVCVVDQLWVLPHWMGGLACLSASATPSLFCSFTLAIIVAFCSLVCSFLPLFLLIIDSCFITKNSCLPSSLSSSGGPSLTSFIFAAAVVCCSIGLSFSITA